jgi:hypothetical protein
MEHFEKLLLINKAKIEKFFNNVSLFDGQFSVTDFNRKCFKEMYISNTYDDNFQSRAVKELKEIIPGLKDVCKKCGSYYMIPRNCSHIKYDVLMGQFFENIIIDYLDTELKINCEHGDKSNKKYPDCMVLGKDRGIIAYFEVKYHGAPFIKALQNVKRFCYESSATLDYDKVIRQLEIIESDLDRPVFYLHWIDYPCIKGIFFETSEQVKNELYVEKQFKRADRVGDLEKSSNTIYKNKIYSRLLNMGTFDEFIETLKGIIK